MSRLVQLVRREQLITSSALILLTTVLMAGAGAVFWIIAARLASPHDVGLAGSLVAAGDALALFAQLGLNIAVLRTMPISTRPAGDVLTAGLIVVVAGIVFGLGYAVLLPWTSPRLADVLDSPLLVAGFAVLVAATALNVLTDSVFLGIDRVGDYLRTNGVLLGIAKCGLPFLLASAGAFGLYGSVAGAIACCALASVWAILRHLPSGPGARRLRPSPELLANRGFAAAGYVTYVLTVLPLLVFPLIVVNALGSAAGGAYFISFQVASLLHAVVLTIANAAYSGAERATERRHAVVRRSGAMLMGIAVAGALVMIALAPYLLRIFGSHYVDSGTATLRVLSLAVVGAAFNYWGMMRLRLAAHLAAMILVQLVSTIVMLGLAISLADRGTVWVAAAWGIGHAVGGLLGFLVTSTVVRFADAAPPRPDVPAAPDRARVPA
jgi:O-antigen/teichoic acid export membrane protein